jgi:hypothetical protein
MRLGYRCKDWNWVSLLIRFCYKRRLKRSKRNQRPGRGAYAFDAYDMTFNPVDLKIFVTEDIFEDKNIRILARKQEKDGHQILIKIQ